MMQKIMPCLWFDKEAEEALNFYIALFSENPVHSAESKIITIQRYPDEAPAEFLKGMEGKVLTAIFELSGYRFMALDGGPRFKFTPAVSFFVQVGSAEEIDRLWDALSDGGTALMPLDSYPFSKKYGWIQDRYGISWQLILAEGSVKSKIVPSLLFVGDQAGQAENAMHFYTELFKEARINDLMRYGAGQEPDKEGTVSYADFTLAGQTFAAMDSAQQHNFTFNEAISFYVECETQNEVDQFWEGLSAVPEAEQCGWLKDKYGVSWQIIPRQLGELINNPDPEKSDRVLKAMLAMKKIDIAGLEEAYAQAV